MQSFAYDASLGGDVGALILSYHNSYQVVVMEVRLEQSYSLLTMANLHAQRIKA